MTPTVSEIARKALITDRTWLALGNEQIEVGGAVFVRNRDLPLVWDANHATAIIAAAPGEIDALFARMDVEYAHLPFRRVRTDFTTPPEFEARLVLEGYRRHDSLVMLLEGPLAGESPRHAMRPVTEPADWAAYQALLRANWSEHPERPDRFDDGVGRQVLRTRQLKSPPVRHWLALVDGMPRAYLSSWEGVDGVGQVEDLFTHPDFRHRGLATALIHHGVADCRAHGAGPVVIVAAPDDTPKHMYAAMGFRPVAVESEYWKDLPRDE